MTGPTSSLPRTINHYHQAYENQSLSVTDVVQAQLARIQASQAQYHGYISWDENAALAAAHALDDWKKRNAHAQLPPLFGITLSIKDNIDVKNMKTTGASFSQVKQPPASHNAKVVQRLIDAGAVILGKANCHEFAFGGPSYDLPTPPATSPWKPDYFPGGSSSGTGVTVAADLCVASLGTDTLGSIRSPAVHCGLVGLKPSYGALPLDGVHLITTSMDHVGPIANTVDDCRRLFSVMANRNAPLKPTPTPYKIGIPLPDWGMEEHLHPEVGTMLDEVIELLTKRGIEVIPLALPNLHDIHACSVLTMMAEVAYTFGPKVRRHYEQFGAMFRKRILAGEAVTLPAYLQAMQDRITLRRALLANMKEVDALLLPGANTPASLLSEVDAFYFLNEPTLNAIANLTGQPTLSLPVAISKAGLPMGIQLLGQPHKEQQLMQLGQTLEAWFSFQAKREQHFAIHSSS